MSFDISCIPFKGVNFESSSQVFNLEWACLVPRRLFIFSQYRIPAVSILYALRLEQPEYSSGNDIFSFVLMTIEHGMNHLHNGISVMSVLHMVYWSNFSFTASTDQSLSSGIEVLLTSGEDVDCTVLGICLCASPIGTGLLSTHAVWGSLDVSLEIPAALSD